MKPCRPSTEACFLCKFAVQTKTIFMKTKLHSLLLASIAFSTAAIGQGTWTQKANYGGPATEKASGFSIGTKGYIGLGTSGTPDFWEWDQATNTWTQEANFTGPTRSFAV